MTPKKVPPITATSNHFALYHGALTGAHTMQDVLAVLHEWRSLASDAYQLVQGIATFTEQRKFLEGLKKELRGRHTSRKWLDRYGLVLFPEVLYKVHVIAVRDKQPWGAAFARAKDAGGLGEEDGIVICHMDLKRAVPEPTPESA